MILGNDFNVCFIGASHVWSVKLVFLYEGDSLLFNKFISIKTLFKEILNRERLRYGKIHEIFTQILRSGKHSVDAH